MNAAMAEGLEPPATSACVRQSRAPVSTALLVEVAPVIASTPTDWFSRIRGIRKRLTERIIATESRLPSKDTSRMLVSSTVIVTVIGEICWKP